jgi:3-oxoacyl-[acyl-carrier-protein] synthase II
MAEIVGFGVSNDATHLSRPDAKGQARAMRLAISDALNSGVDVADIGYVNAHATGTKIGDQIETKALKAIFGAQVINLPISSTKALLGHMMGAAGAVEFIASLTAMQREIAPPTAHLWHRDPECDLDYVAITPRPLPGLRAIMSNSFAFGGTNAVLIARAFKA